MDQGLSDSSSHAGPRQLVQASLFVQSSFKLTPDAHLLDTLASSGASSVEDQDFVREAFTGVVRYQTFLKPVVDLLYIRHR